MTKSQQTIRDLVRVMYDRTGNLPPLPDIFLDYPAPIFRNTPDCRERQIVPPPHVRFGDTGRVA
jgi:hypothetical protein